MHSHILSLPFRWVFAHNFFRAMTLDPGTCPTPKSDAELKSVGNSALRVVPILYFMFVLDN